MKPAMALAALVLFAAADASAGDDAPPPVPPNKLAGMRFYLEDFAKKVADGHFDPLEYFEADPVSIAFVTKDHLLIEWGQESQDCAFSVIPDANPPADSNESYVLKLSCDSSIKLAHWSWLGPGRARTDIVWKEPEVMVHVEGSFDDLKTEYQRRLTEKSLAELAGRYKDLSGKALLVLGGNGQASMDGVAYKVEVVECLTPGKVGIADGSPTRLTCLKLVDDASDIVVFGVKHSGNDHLLEQGRILWDLFPDGPLFERTPDGRRLLSVR
ncbi:MAG: hypothetical protein U0166_27415 [Acidobacteriota bacterium]